MVNEVRSYEKVYDYIHCLCAYWFMWWRFYREFTKFNAFEGTSTLSVIHTHYFVLGMMFFSLLLVLEKTFSFSNKKTNISLICYQVGLNITGIMFLTRGIVQTLGISTDSTTDAIISGFAGIGHVILGVSLVVFLIFLAKQIIGQKKVDKSSGKNL